MTGVGCCILLCVRRIIRLENPFGGVEIARVEELSGEGHIPLQEIAGRVEKGHALGAGLDDTVGPFAGGEHNVADLFVQGCERGGGGHLFGSGRRVNEQAFLLFHLFADPRNDGADMLPGTLQIIGMFERETAGESGLAFGNQIRDGQRIRRGRRNEPELARGEQFERAAQAGGEVGVFPGGAGADGEDEQVCHVSFLSSPDTEVRVTM